MMWADLQECKNCIQWKERQFPKGDKDTFTVRVIPSALTQFQHTSIVAVGDAKLYPVILNPLLLVTIVHCKILAFCAMDT